MRCPTCGHSTKDRRAISIGQLAIIDGESINLTLGESRVWDVLVRNQGHFTHGKSIARLAQTSVKMVYSHIAKLRAKIKDTAAWIHSLGSHGDEYGYELRWLPER